MKRAAQSPPRESRKVQHVSCPCCEARLALHFIRGEDEVYDVQLLGAAAAAPQQESHGGSRMKDGERQGAQIENGDAVEARLRNTDALAARNAMPSGEASVKEEIVESRVKIEAQPPPELQPKKEASGNSKLFPLFYRPIKTVHLVRHGQTSLWAGPEGAAGLEHRFDLRLTPLGHQQASNLAPKMASLKPDLVLVSPLRRALETLQGAFPYAQDDKERVEVTALHTEHVSCSGDIGRPPQVLAKEYPWLSFEALPDVWWYSHPNFPNDAVKMEFNSVEPMEEVRKRVGLFRQFLRSRPENVIAVIGHSTFFKELTSRRQRMKNCEVHTIML